MYVISSEMSVIRYRHSFLSAIQFHRETIVLTQNLEPINLCISHAVQCDQNIELRQCDSVFHRYHTSPMLICISLVLWSWITFSTFITVGTLFIENPGRNRTHKTLQLFRLQNMLSWHRQSSARSWRINTTAWRLPFCFIVWIYMYHKKLSDFNLFGKKWHTCLIIIQVKLHVY